MGLRFYDVEIGSRLLLGSALYPSPEILRRSIAASGAEIVTLSLRRETAGGRGLNNPYGLRTLRNHFPEVPLVVDAGIGRPSHAAEAMELGYDAILLNTAVAKAGNPITMAEAFGRAVSAGRLAFEAQPMEERDMASPSTPLADLPFSMSEA